MKPNLWIEAAGMGIVFAGAMVFGLSFQWSVGVIAAYFAVVFLYEVYAARFNQRERVAKRRARRTETGLYGWPMTDVQAQTVVVTPRGTASVEPAAPRIVPAVAAPVDPEVRLEEPRVASAPVVDDVPEPPAQHDELDAVAPEAVEVEVEAEADVESDEARSGRGRRVPWRRDEIREAPVRGDLESEPELAPEAPVAAEPAPAREPVPVAGPVASAPPVPEPTAVPAALAPEARGSQWNVWELERAMQSDPTPSSDRAYERTVLLMFLRDYASSDGQLPPEFDELVRDAFSELLALR